MKQTAAALVAQLENAKRDYGPGSAARVETMLGSIRGLQFSNAESLIHFHDTLLFLRAFPQSRKVVTLSEGLLSDLAERVSQLRGVAADLDLFDDEQFSGIAGTALREAFTYEVARWLARRDPTAVRAEWNVDEQGWQMSSSLPQLLPLLGDDCFVEADTPYLTWLDAAAGGEARILQWLLERVEKAPLTLLQKTAWYDALKIEMVWELGDSRASRTHARRNPRQFFYHNAPLIQRKKVSLAEELSSPPLAVRRLGRREAEDLLHQAREVLTVRYRELWGTTRGDCEQVVECDAGRGVSIFLWGLPPQWRLPMRAYHCGITTKNGVPVNYFEAISLAEWMEVGFNTFYAFREGETAWIYSKILHLLHQVAGVTCFSVYPYQLGHDNEEAIQSGAFWFYRKLGFRPGNPELLALTEREEKKIAAQPGYRTPARILRKLAAGHVFYEFDEQPRCVWDRFSVRNIGFAVQRHMARKFKGDPDEMQRKASAGLSQTLRVDVRRWSELERSAFGDFAAVLALVPELARWSNAEKNGVAEVIRAKADATELRYLRLLRQHDKLKQALLKLGSSTADTQSRPTRDRSS